MLPNTAQLPEAESVIPGASDQAVWPWQAEPYRLWSLLDMLTAFGFGHIGSDLINLERAGTESFAGLKTGSILSGTSPD